MYPSSARRPLERAWERYAREGTRGVLAAGLRRAGERLASAAAQPQALPPVVLECDYWRRGAVQQPERLTGPLSVAIVIPRYSTGAGGHANIFRLANQLANAGLSVRIAVTDSDSVDIVEQRRLIGALSGGVPVDSWDGPGQVNVLMATSWTTAYEVYAAANSEIATCYLVQDHEPLFYPASSLSLLAGLTYRFGFTTITLGGWLQEELQARYGVMGQVVDFGYDGTTYALPTSAASRDGVVFYGRASTPRRCVELGTEALRLFARDHPDVPIRVVGRAADEPRLPFAHEDLGMLSQDDLAALFQRSAAALVLSASNLSLLPLELMACGVLPVVNEEFRLPESVPETSYRAVPSLPAALSAALADVVAAPPPPAITASAVAHLAYDTLPPQIVEVFEALPAR